MGQRKKLSDSFRECGDDDMTGFRRIEDLTDAGYHTGPATMSEESWGASKVFASTPTKINKWIFMCWETLLYGDAFEDMTDAYYECNT